MRNGKVVFAVFALTGAAFAVLVGQLSRDGADPVRVELNARHYAQAEREIASADVSGLTPERRAARERLLGELRAYREARDYGRDSDGVAERRHLFVDDEGRRCAVAQLLHATGDDTLVSDVAATNNGAFVSDLADDARFLAWLDRNGLSLEEAARIQAPATHAPTGEIQQSGSSDTNGNTNTGTPTTQTGEPGRPVGSPGGDTGGGPTTPGGGVAGGPTSPGGGGGAGRGARTGTKTPSNRPFSGIGADAWSDWWEFEKLAWVKPARDCMEQAPATSGYDPVADLATKRAAAVGALLPHLTHKDPAVRGAAAIAVGRLGGKSAVDKLLPLLGDEKPVVRNRAILALGATGDERAAARLLEIAEGTEQDAPTYVARQLAVVALGVAKRHGLRTDPGARIASLLDRAKSAREEPLADAAAMYAALVRSDAVVRRLQDLADESGVPAALRGRALEALPPRSDAATVRVLQTALGESDVDLRRSSSIALGAVPSPLVAAHLMTAAELESDGLTRGLLLLSIGHQGGARAEGFLAAALEDKDEAMRPWAALSLGFLAREHDGAPGLAALGKAKLRERDTGALWLARALAGEAGVAEACIDALDDGDPRRRTQAATALALLPGEETAAALRARAAEESEDEPAVALALAVALRGDAKDSQLLLATGRKFRPEWTRAPVAMALGLHRTRDTVDGLIAALESPRSSAQQVSIAADAIGIALDAVPAPVLPAVGRSTNLATMPDWVLAALRSTL